MKLSVSSFLGSFKKSSSNPLKKKNKVKKISRRDTSFGSNTTSSSEDSSASSQLHATPKSVLPTSPGHPRLLMAPGKAPVVVFSDDFSSSSTSSAGNGGVVLSVNELFSVFDRDGDGKITKRELEAVLRRLGRDPPTADEVESMLADADRDGDGCISLEEFGALGAAAFEPPVDGWEDEIRDTFTVFDADGDGKISAEELLEVFVALGDYGCTIEDCRRMIGGVDSDGDGFVCFEDFARMMDGRSQ